MTPSLIDAPRGEGRVATLDVMRFVFAMWVLLLAHLLFWAAYDGQALTGEGIARWLVDAFQTGGETHPAVLGFIVLSGYCIHRAGFRRGTLDRSTLRTFAIRRSTRIAPVFLLAILVGVVAFEISARIDREATVALSGTQGIEPLIVLVKMLTVDAWVPGWNFEFSQGNAPIHTVAAEIWLYALYPVVILVLGRVRERWLWLFLIGLELVAALVLSGHPEWVNWWHNVSGFGFLLYWWVGAKMVTLVGHPRLPFLAIGGALAWGALTAVMQTESTAFLVVEARKTALAIVVGCLIAAVDRPFPVPRFAARLGEGGYSLYAFHAPIAYLGVVVGLWWPVVAAIAIAVGLGMFRTVERPAMRWGRKRTQRVRTTAPAQS